MQKILNVLMINIYLLFLIGLAIIFPHVVNETTIVGQVLQPEVIIGNEPLELSVFESYDLGYYITSDGVVYSQNAHNFYTAGSTIKVGIALIIADGLVNGTYNLDDSVYYDESFYEEGTGIIFESEIENSYPVDYLVELMLRYSDNIATNMLLYYIGIDNYVNYFASVTNGEFDASSNAITPFGGYRLVERLYNNESSNPYYDEIIKLLKDTIFDDRFSLYLDNDIVAHKIGAYGDYYNDIGIIYGNSDIIASAYCYGTYDVCNELEGQLVKQINED